MPSTNENEKEEQKQKINFQLLRKCVFADHCHINHRKCFINLLLNQCGRVRGDNARRKTSRK